MCIFLIGGTSKVQISLKARRQTTFEDALKLQDGALMFLALFLLITLFPLFDCATNTRSIAVSDGVYTKWDFQVENWSLH